MRSVDDLRLRWLSMVAGVVARPGMYAATGSEIELMADGLLADLCFLDDRDADYEIAREELLSRYGTLGVPGPFKTMFGLERCQAEVTAVYAEVFSRLGYLPVENALDPGRWDQLTAALPALLGDRDMRRSEAERVLGRASIVIEHRILCYASSRPGDGWLFLDCQADDCRAYDLTTGSYQQIGDPEPIVRSARRSVGGFEDGLILTPYGKLLRWGPGWWIDDADPDWTPQAQAIAGQLRDADPFDQPAQTRPEAGES
jgi:hypothetical protein